MLIKHRGNFADLIIHKKYQNGLEIGVRNGFFSHLLVSKTKIKWHAIDPWVDNKELKNAAYTHQYAKSLLEPLGVILIKDYAENVVGQFEDGSIDFIYIDALHDYDSVLRDLRLWWQKLAKGGCMAGHDYSLRWPGVIRAVQVFTGKNNISYNVTGVGDRYGESDYYEPSWYFFKE